MVNTLQGCPQDAMETQKKECKAWLVKADKLQKMMDPFVRCGTWLCGRFNL